MEVDRLAALFKKEGEEIGPNEGPMEDALSRRNLFSMLNLAASPAQYMDDRVLLPLLVVGLLSTSPLLRPPPNAAMKKSVDTLFFALMNLSAAVKVL
jgi:hypothetical protein